MTTRLPFSILIAFALAACGTTTEEAAEVAITAPLYAVVAIPATVTYPFWKSAANASKKRHIPKSKEYITRKYGRPVAKYDCQGIEIWEYGKKQNADEHQFVLLLEHMNTSFEIGKVSLLEDCGVIEGVSLQGTKEFWLAEILPCGLNYKKQVHDRDLFFVDMGAAQGTLTIESEEPPQNLYNAGFVVMYEETPIYEHHKYHSIIKRPYEKTRIEKVHFGPGESTFLEVLVTSKPAHVLLTPYHYDLWISCPK